MNAGDFRRGVEAEVGRIRAAHVVEIGAIVTDVVVAVTLFIDNELHEYSRRVTNMEERERAFEDTLVDLRVLRRHLLPKRRATPRFRIPVERHIGEPSWPGVAFVAACLAAVMVLGWWLS